MIDNPQIGDKVFRLLTADRKQPSIRQFVVIEVWRDSCRVSDGEDTARFGNDSLFYTIDALINNLTEHLKDTAIYYKEPNT
jgi:hypothetical protein